MMLEEKFARLREENRKAFIVYLPFGYPDIKKTEDIIFALQRAGVDVIEIGVPFSDPLADGRIIQEAALEALKKGADAGKLFVMLERIKKSLTVPLVIMTYYNPFFRFGEKKFFRGMRRAGISGLMIVDLPLEESAEHIKRCGEFGLEPVFFVTPTTSECRAKKIAERSKGFVYYVSVTGITGPQEIAFSGLRSRINKLRRAAGLPVCVGFGIHTRVQVKAASAFSDGVIVGSGIVEFIGRRHRGAGFLSELERYVKYLKSGFGG